MPTKTSLIQSIVYAPLGNLVLPREAEIDPAADITPALIKYYKHVPIKVGKPYTITNNRTLEIAHTSVFPDYNPASPSYTGDYFYVGVVHHAIRHQLGQNAFNQNLLGLDVGIPVSNPMENVGMATQIDVSTGDTYYEEDFVNDKTVFVVGGSGTLSVVFGVGHFNVEKIPFRHVDVVARLVAVAYYDRLISIRKTGAFTGADFTISSDQLVAMRDEAAEKSKEDLDNVGFMAMTIG